jgi:hypothetical protein
MKIDFKDTEDLITIIFDEINSSRVDRIMIAEGFEYILDNDLWQVRKPSALNKVMEFDYFPDFCAAPSPWGLSCDWDYVLTISEVNNRILHKVTEAGKRGHGGDRKSDKIKYDNVKLDTPDGNNKAYGLSKLKKDRPDLFEKVTDKEMSVHAAMVKAGFRKRKIQVEATPEKIARAIKKHLDEDQIANLIKILMT